MTDNYLNNDLREFYEGSSIFNNTPFDELIPEQIKQLHGLYDIACAFFPKTPQLVLFRFQLMEFAQAAYRVAEVIRKINDEDLFNFIRKNAPRKTPKRSKIIKRIKK